jgi:hypothetical protein
MSFKKTYEKKMQARLNELAAEIDELREKAEQMEVNLQLEYYTFIDELQVKLEIARQKFDGLNQADEEDWEEFKNEFELIWKSLRELIKSVTSP